MVKSFYRSKLPFDIEYKIAMMTYYEPYLKYIILKYWNNEDVIKNIYPRYPWYYVANKCDKATLEYLETRQNRIHPDHKWYCGMAAVAGVDALINYVTVTKDQDIARHYNLIDSNNALNPEEVTISTPNIEEVKNLVEQYKYRNTILETYPNWTKDETESLIVKVKRYRAAIPKVLTLTIPLDSWLICYNDNILAHALYWDDNYDTVYLNCDNCCILLKPNFFTEIVPVQVTVPCNLWSELERYTE